MEYAQIVSYMPPTQAAKFESDTFCQSSLPSFFRPAYHLPQPWNQEKGNGRLTEDFILIAEFSELEGPKPLMTIPKDGGAGFDQNAFSLRILAVDHQYSASDGFTISEDAQVVVADTETDVFAFVHHLVLYDNTARGFVRPYCIAYITHDQRKLMHFYEDLSWKFKKVARYFKYGNKMMFAADLERHLKDLEYTKNYLLNQACKIRLRNPEGQEEQIPDSRRNAENELYNGLQTIQQSSLEIKEILSILKPLLPDRRLEARFRLLEDRVYEGCGSSGQDKWSLPESGFNDFSLGDLDMRCGSLSEPRISPLALFKPREYKPVLVETKKAKRFNVPLRGLHELCSWGAKEGLKKLRHIQMYFKRDSSVLLLEKNESRLFRPKYAGIYHGQCITGNFLAGIQLKKSLNAAEEAEHGWSLLYSHQWGSVGSLDSQDSFKSADSYATNTGITEASPSSFQTYDSQSGNIFHSASTSPEIEFSLLMSHEYYPGLEASQELESARSNISIHHLQDEKNVTTNNREAIQMSVTEDYSQGLSGTLPEDRDHWQNEVKDIDADDKTSLQFSGQVLIENSFIRPSSISYHTQKSISDDRFRNEMLVGNQEGTNEIEMSDSDHRNNMLKILRENSIIKDGVCKETDSLSFMGECSNRDIWSEGVGVNAGQESWQGIRDLYLTVPGAFEDGGYSDASTEDNTLVGHVDDAAQSFSIGSFCSSESFNTSDVKSDGQIGINIESLPGNFKSVPDVDRKLVRSGSFDGCLQFVDKGGNTGTGKTRCILQGDSKLSVMLRQEMNKTGGRMLLASSSEISKSEPNISHTSVQSSLQTAGGIVSTRKSSDKLQSLRSSHQAADNKINSTSNFLSPNHPKLAPHVTQVSHLQNEKSSQSGTNDEDESVRTRSESDRSSAYTEISLQDLYPHLVGTGGLLKDMTLFSDVLEGNEAGVDEFIDIPSSQKPVSWKPRCGMYTVGDWINNLSQGRPGSGLSEVLSTYQYLDHVIFSLLSGRPVLVAGSAKLELEVIRLVSALAVFVPETRRKRHTVLEWTTKPLKITDLTSLKLVGLCRPERRSLDSYIPSSVKKASTIIDIEKRIIVAPPYQGQFITALISRKKVLKSDVQLLTYIEWWLMDILAKAFIFFHCFCLGSAGSALYSHRSKHQRDTYQAAVSGIMTRLGVKDCDCEIIEHLSEMVKLSKLEAHIWQDVDSGSVVSPLTLRHKICEKFKF